MPNRLEAWGTCAWPNAGALPKLKPPELAGVLPKAGVDAGAPKAPAESQR